MWCENHQVMIPWTTRSYIHHHKIRGNEEGSVSINHPHEALRRKKRMEDIGVDDEEEAMEMEDEMEESYDDEDQEDKDLKV